MLRKNSFITFVLQPYNTKEIKYTVRSFYQVQIYLSGLIFFQFLSDGVLYCGSQFVLYLGVTDLVIFVRIVLFSIFT